MSDRNFNNFNNFNDDFDDDDDFLETSERGVRGIGSDRNSAVLNPFIQEIEQIPPEHLSNLLQMIRLFRQSVALAEQIARTKARNSPPIQPTVLPPVEPIAPTPTDAAPVDLDAASTDPDAAPIDPIDPIDRLLMRSQFELPSDRATKQITQPPAESSQEPPLIPSRLPWTAEADVEPAAEPLDVTEPGEYVVKPAPTEDESDWDELMDFLDQDNPKNFREEDGRNDDWDEYFRPSP